MKELVISKENEGQRVDKFVRKYIKKDRIYFVYKSFRKKEGKVKIHYIKNE